MLNHFKHSEEDKADEVEKNYLEDGKIESQKNGNDRKYKKGFVMNSRKETFG